LFLLVLDPSLALFDDIGGVDLGKKNDEVYKYDSYMDVGAVANTHGVKGEIKIFPHTFDVKRFDKLEEIILIKNGAEKTYAVENVKHQKQFVLLKLKNVGDMNAAALLKGALVCVPKDLALPLGADEYYIGDIIGCRVSGLNGEPIGEITGVTETGAHDIYEATAPDGREILIPAVKRYIHEIDIKNKHIRAEIPEMYLA